MTSNHEKSSLTRRDIVKAAAAGAATASVAIATTREAEAQDTYDAIVIGTGFGGTIASLALNAQNKKVLVIERGTFWVTPETLGSPPKSAAPPLGKWAADNNMRVQYWSRPDHLLGLLDLLENRYHDGNRYGLYNYRRFKQAHILTASAVGGGAMIYSNVNFRAEDAVLQRRGLNGLNYDRAEKFMQTYRGKLSKVVTKIPLPPGMTPETLGSAQDYLLLDRSRALRDAAASVAGQLGITMPWAPLNLSVTEYVPGPGSEADQLHTFCERQGRCMLGCLPQARHTLNKTLYKFIFSKNTRVTLTPESEVRTIRPTNNGYEVTYIDRRGPDGESGRQVRVSTPQVFLAAGVLGTTEILMRSQRDVGLSLSDRLGRGFSTNGDFGALAVGTKFPDGSKMSVYPTRGPINTAGIHFDTDGRHFTIEDCGIPSMFARIARTGIDDRLKLLALASPAAFYALNTLPTITRKKDASKDNHATEAELIDDVFFFNAMGEDDASGHFTLQGETLDLDWDQPIGDHPVFAQIESVLQKLSQAMGGTYTPLPTWEGLPLVFNRKTLIVTHPLGGCGIGPTMSDGVVNEFGQVYDGSKKATDATAVHPGLFIVDGSTMPGALAANPTLTISAQAIKVVDKALGPMPI